MLMTLWGAMFALLLTPLVIRLARKSNLVDSPGPRKVHRAPLPRLGGLAIAVAALAVAAPMAISDGGIWREVLKAQGPLTALVVCALGLFAVGLVGDGRAVSARIKLGCQVPGA